MSPGGHWLVVRGGALGDFVVTEPAIAEVRRRAGRVTLAADPRFARLWPEHADAVIDLRGREALWLFGDLTPPFVPDAALTYTPGTGERLRALGVPLVIECASLPVRLAHEHFFDPLARTFGATARPPRILPDPSTTAKMVVRIPSSPVVLAPGAGSPTKIWPHFDRLARALTARGIAHVCLKGPAERALEIEGPVLTDLDLREVVALAALSRAWIGNDSGPTHLARAAGARTLALFGPTDPSLWAPPGASTAGFPISPEAVAEWVADGASRDILGPHSGSGEST